MLNPDYRDMLFALSDAGADFLVVGAFAMAAHGYPRATGDIDLWIRPSAQNAERVWQALRSFGAPLFDLALDDLMTPDTVFQIGVAPRRIDILTAVDGLEFDQAWTGRKVIEIEGRSFATLGKADLLANKRAAGRPKDLADVVWLEAKADDS